MDNKMWHHQILVGVLVVFMAIIAYTPSAVAADTYPNRPINLIVGFSPGGASDLVSTIIAEKWSIVLGQTIVNVHKPGAGGLIAASYVRKAKADGYTLMIAANSMWQPTEVKKLDYTIDDFAFMGRISKSPFFACVHAKSRWKNLKEFVEEAKKNPGKITYGTTGTNVGGYYVAQMLSKEAGIKLNLVPFKSCGDAMTGLLGQHVDSYFCPGVGAVGESGLVRILALPEEKRMEGFEQAPTFTELGYPIVYSGGHTIAGPKEMPREVIKKLTDTLKVTMEKYSKEIGAKLKNANLFPVYADPQGAVKWTKDVYELEARITRESKEAGK